MVDAGGNGRWFLEERRMDLKLGITCRTDAGMENLMLENH